MSKWYRAEIEAAARKHELDADLVEAVVETESSGEFHAYRFEPAFFDRYLANNPRYNRRNPQEVSASYGLMQVMFSTACDHGYEGTPAGLFEPAVSLDYGCRHLASLLAWARNVVCHATELETIAVRSALAAYNGGKRGNAPDNEPDRNAAYAEKVLKRYDRIRAARN